MFGWIKDTGWPWVRRAFQAIGDKAKWLWDNAIRPYFGKVLSNAKTVFGWIKDKGAPKVRSAFQSIGDKAKWLWETAKTPFDRLKSGVSSVKDAVERAAKGIKSAWSKLNDYLRDPIRKALSWMNSKFIGGLNGLLDTKILSIPKKWRIPKIPGFATGGWTGPGARLQPAGVVHADEFVVKKSSRRKFERDNPGALDHINRFGTLPGYAIGGNVAGLNKKFMEQLSAFNAAAGNRYSVNSGYRSNAEQERLYARYLAGNGPVAAPPGSSQHNKGLAADLAPSNARDVHGGLAKKFGLVFTVPSESWHIEPTWGRSGGGGGGFGFGLPSWLSNPLKWVKDKMSGVVNGFKEKANSYGIAGRVLPATMDKLKESVSSRVKKAADALTSFGGGGGGTNMDWSKIKGGPNRILGKQMAAQYGWTGAQWNALSRLWDKESNWNHKARNPSSGAYGIPQALPASKMASIMQGGGPDYLTNAKTQISWGLRYIKCVPLDTEILTRRGWLAHDEVQVGDETIGYDPATGAAVWTRITHVHHYEEAPVTRLSNSRWESRSTPNHRWVTEKYQQRVGDYGFRQEMTQTQHLGTRHRLVLAAPHESDTKLDITPKEAELLGWVMGDGSIYYGRNNRGGKRGKLSMSVAQTKPKYMAELRECLSEIPHSEYVTRPNHWSTNEGASFRLRSDFARDLLERSGYERDPEAMVLGMSQEQREAFFRGFMFADGHVPTSGASPMFSQNEGWKLDVALLTMYLLGHYGNPTDSAGHKHVTVGKATVKADFREEVLERQAVWCVTTEADTWTMRQGGRVMLTGNSRYGNPAAALAFHNRMNWYAGGGLVKPAVFDNGGTLAPGLNLVNNKLGRPEPLVRPEQIQPQVSISFAPGTEWLSDFVQTEISFANGFDSAHARMGA